MAVVAGVVDVQWLAAGVLEAVDRLVVTPSVAPLGEGQQHRHELAARFGEVVFEPGRAQSTVYAATEDLPGGAYVGPGGFRHFRGAPAVLTPAAVATDPDVAPARGNSRPG